MRYARRMISGLIDVAHPSDPDTIDHLADTLAALVPGVSSGLVGDAVIVTTWLTQALDTIADGSGATLVQRPVGAWPWSVGAAAARRDWVLCLEAGDVPREGWIRTLDRFIATARPDVAIGRGRRMQDRLALRIASLWGGVVGASRPRAGDVVRRDRLLGSSAQARRLALRRVPVWIDRD